MAEEGVLVEMPKQPSPIVHQRWQLLGQGVEAVAG
jgi:hypothetical protein